MTQVARKAAKTLEFKIERTIAAAPTKVFDAWLNPKMARREEQDMLDVHSIAR